MCFVSNPSLELYIYFIEIAIEYTTFYGYQMIEISRETLCSDSLPDAVSPTTSIFHQCEHGRA